ncbi:MAG: AAA family ATPase [Bacteroidota bacterium]
MKIVKITFQNINSLKGEHEIDFTKEPLKSQSLFAITGATGSGKSTLLDVICLALFNEIPRLGKMSKNAINQMGSVITRHQKEAFAAVEYQTKSGNYLSQWRISTSRNNTLRDYEMQLTDLNTQTEFDLKKSDVPAKNQELIGLSYPQFIKSILLAQGQFSKFIEASKNEKYAILEQITGSHIYREIGKKAYQKGKEVESTVNQIKQQIEVLNEKLLSEEDFQTRQQDLEKKNSIKENISKAFDAIKIELQIHKDVGEINKAISKTETNLNQFQKDFNQFNETHQKSIVAHEKTQAIADEINSWESYTSHLEKSNLKQTETRKNISSLQENENQILQKVDDFLPENAVKEKVEEQLQLFEKRFSAIVHKRDELRNTLQREMENVTGLSADLDWEFNPKTFDDSKKNLELLHQNLIENQQQLSKELPESDLAEIKKKSEGIDEEILNISTAKSVWEKSTELANELQKIQQTVEKKTNEIVPLKNQIEKQETTIELREKDLELYQEKLQHQQLRAKYEDIRKQLKDGESCPLCGATEHPFTENLPQQENQLEQEIKERNLALKKLQEDVNKKKQLLNSITTSVENLNHQTEKLKQKQSENDLDKKKFNQLNEERKSITWQEFIQQKKELKTVLKTYLSNHQKLDAITKISKPLKTAERLIIEGKEKKQQLQELYKGDENEFEKTKTLLQNQWRNNQQDLAVKENQLNDIVSELKEYELKLEKLIAENRNQLQTLGFENFEMASRARMKVSEFTQLKEKEQKLASNIKEQENSLKIYRKNLAESKNKLNNKSLENTQKEHRKIESELNEINQKIQELTYVLKNQNQLQSEKEQLEKENKKTLEENNKWLLLNKMIGDATGNQFNNYAQDLTLKQLVYYANKRLVQLNNRYEIDLPTENEGDSLMIIDFHMGGERRSIKTLSGGETFIVSLSMALALSDLASKNVEINSLFIDEGFGTLDPETLDQTLDTLERLQTESNKTIGIISHVDALKERVQTQIQLEKNGQGYSSLQISS